MTDPRKISIDAYDYALPASRIASFPLPERDASRLLIWKQGHIGQDVFRNLPAHLPENAFIVFNNTRVVEARLLFRKPTGGRIEIFCLEPGDRYPDVTSALATTGAVEWKCLVGNASGWPAGMILEKTIPHAHTPIGLQAEMISKEAGYITLRLSWQPQELSFAEVLHHAGLIPLPPYIKRAASATDAERYQTVYAHSSGSVAAPTAGLHFTPAVLDHLKQKGIQNHFVTLHVGAGTFKPVKSDTMEEHDMHAEFIEVSRSLVEGLIGRPDGKLIAVGTTTLRTLESLYWLGKQLADGHTGPEQKLQVAQWEPYQHTGNDLPVNEALSAILRYMEQTRSELLIAKTSLLIAPGYSFRIVDALITNFHQPRSTLLLLVSAFIGEKWKSVYSYALENDFRFLSYGDACLLFRR